MVRYGKGWAVASSYQEGMVQPQKKNIVISFEIELYPTEFFVNNILSSMDFEVTKKIIADIYGL